MEQTTIEETEKMLGATSGGPWLRLAQVISFLANPLLVVLPLCLIVAMATAPSLIQGLSWWGITTVGVSGAPLLFIWYGVRRGRYSDHHISKREQRLIPILFALGSVTLAFILLLVIQASTELTATLTAMLTSGVIALLVTQFLKYKISLHLVGMTGTVITLGQLIHPLLFLLAPLILLVGWARWLVKAHTPLQALAGFGLAVLVSIIVFWPFQLL